MKNGRRQGFLFDRTDLKITSKMTQFDDTQIISSWEQNAEAWIEAIQNEKIESRELVTNQAIIDATMAYKPATALDVGCGEGWLTRALAQQDIDVLGVDIVKTSIANARKLGSGNFELCSYEELAAGRLRDRIFEAIICNVSLLGKESVDNLINAVPSLLTPTGHLFIQTLHPFISWENKQYKDGWRPGSWDGFGAKFKNPAPWYFRTMETWMRLFNKNGLVVRECREPVHPETKTPASMLFICAKR
jgi:2-polyprenyl-3-methyl-5-hydroxy-6-metoxy-1,4-benzoquinol methylase